MPIAYGFCNSATKHDKLVKAILEVTLLAKECGFKVIATVCDQESSNQRAIKDLLSISDSQGVRETLKNVS